MYYAILQYCIVFIFSSFVLGVTSRKIPLVCNIYHIPVIFNEQLLKLVKIIVMP